MGDPDMPDFTTFGILTSRQLTAPIDMRIDPSGGIKR